MVGLSAGQLVLSMNTDTLFRDEDLGKHIEIVRPQIAWWIECVHEPVNVMREPVTKWYIWIPIWMFIVPASGVAGIAWWFDARARRSMLAGKCARCGYDRSGLESECACPECGRVKQASERA